MTSDITLPKVKSPAVLAHFVLVTNQFKPMVDYYKTFLGADVRYENEMMSFLTYDDEHHRIAIAAFPGTTDKPPKAAGLHHVAFTFNNLDDLVLTYEQRKAHGILPAWCVNHGVTTSMYYKDPDGNQIEVQVDNFDTVEESMAYMLGPEFASNPIGTNYDPEELVRRVKSGEDQASIKKKTGNEVAQPVV